ncbi:MAG: ATP-grasp fold amidoligase family protein [Clostridia bacterium]
MNKLLIILSNPKFAWNRLYYKFLSRLIPDSIYLRIEFRKRVGYPLNLRNPQTYNEKLQWLKLHDRNPQYVQLVDKFEVRDYVKHTIGEEFLIPLIGVFDKVEDIEYNRFPHQFVLKPTHSSGDVVICRNKSKLDIKKANDYLNKRMKNNLFWSGREWPYKNIKPRIICEELLINDSQDDLVDYKILCFNGVPKCLFLCLDRRSESGLKVDFYDLDWNPLPFERHYPRSGKIIEKPACFNEMLDLSRKLSKDIPFVRVDFYIVNNQIKFGELTFFPGSGFEEFTPESYDYLLGSWIDLSLVEKNQKEDANVRKVR